MASEDPQAPLTGFIGSIAQGVSSFCSEYNITNYNLFIPPPRSSVLEAFRDWVPLWNITDVVTSYSGDTTENLQTVIRDNPLTRFVLVDAAATDTPGINVQEIFFKEDQAGLVAGTFAAFFTTTNITGVIGGYDLRQIRKFRNGFVAGCLRINPNCRIASRYINDWLSVERGVAAGDILIREGADVIYGAGGDMGSAGIAYAASRGRYVIGVDVDEYYSTFDSGRAPGSDRLIVSTIKECANAVYTGLKSTFNLKGSSGGVQSQGLITYSDCHGIMCNRRTNTVMSAVEKAKTLTDTGVETDTGYLKFSYTANKWTSQNIISACSPDDLRRNSLVDAPGPVGVLYYSGGSGNTADPNVWWYDRGDNSWTKGPTSNLTRVDWPAARRHYAVGLHRLNTVLIARRTQDECEDEYAEMLVYGGIPPDANAAPVDDVVWAFSPCNFTTYIGLPLGTSPPVWRRLSSPVRPPQFMHSIVVFCPSAGTCLLHAFGGSITGGPAYSNELRIFDTSGQQWLSGPGFTGIAPPARRLHSAILMKDAEGRPVMAVYGGEGASGPLNDVWFYTFASQTWRQLLLGNAPPANTGMTMIAGGAPMRALVIGGGETWTFHSNSTVWQQVVVDASVPTASVNGSVAMLGGLDIPGIRGFAGLSYVWGSHVAWVLKYETACPHNCSLRGVCDLVVGECRCYDGYLGLDCSTKAAQPAPIVCLGKSCTPDPRIGEWVAAFVIGIALIVLVVVLVLWIRAKRRRAKIAPDTEVVFEPKYLVNRKDLVFDNRVGAGGFGEVWRGHFRDTEVAIKMLLSAKSPAQIKQFKEEIETLNLLRHPNIVLFMGACIEDANLAMITEFLPGSLYDVLRGDGDLPWHTRLQYAHDAAKGMSYLHAWNPPILHRDLKSPNLLITDKFIVKVADFGISHIAGAVMTALPGSVPWTAPEVLSDNKFSEASDVYSFGIILWEFFARDDPFKGLHIGAIARQVTVDQNRPPLPPLLPGAMKTLIQRCWAPNPADRPTFSALMAQLQPFMAYHDRVQATATIPPRIPPRGSVAVALAPWEKSDPSSQFARLAAAMGGFVVELEGKSNNSYCAVAFSSTRVAVEWCLSVQKEPLSAASDTPPDGAIVGRTPHSLTDRQTQRTPRAEAVIVDDDTAPLSDREPLLRPVRGSPLQPLGETIRTRSQGSVDATQGRTSENTVLTTPRHALFNPTLPPIPAGSSNSGLPPTPMLVTAPPFSPPLSSPPLSSPPLSSPPPSSSPPLSPPEGRERPTSEEPREESSPSTQRDGMLPSPTTPNKPISSAAPVKQNSKVNLRGTQEIEMEPLELAKLQNPPPPARAPTVLPPFRFAIHFGNPDRHANARQTRVRFQGTMIRRAEAVFSHVTTTQILLSPEAKAELNLEPARASLFELTDLPPVSLGEEGAVPLTEVKAAPLYWEIEAFARDARHQRKGIATARDEPVAEPSRKHPTSPRFLINFEDIKLGVRVGLGSFGEVFAGNYRGQDVAVKRLLSCHLRRAVEDDFAEEVALMSRVNHPNIVTFVGYCFTRPNICVVTELMSRGTLREVLDRNKSLDWPVKLNLALQIAAGMNYLHTLSILHRDLKSDNVLIGENWEAKISDFGFARVKEQTSTMTQLGTVAWSSPEILLGRQYSEKCDVFSYGIILWELLTQLQPYKGLRVIEIVSLVVEGERPRLPRDTPPEYANLVNGCWAPTPTTRPAFSQVMNDLQRISKAVEDDARILDD